MVQINGLLGNKALIKLMDFFISNSSKEFSQTQVRKTISLSKTTSIKWLDELVNLDLVKLKKIGNSNLYSLNRKSCIVRQIKVLKSLMQVERLKNINAEVYLYGSAARGEDIEDSDIDLLLIGKLDRRQVIQEIESVAKKINRKISFKIFDSFEWSKIARTDRPFYERVEKDRIRIE